MDMNLPERFDLFYIDETGERVRPVMLHRAIYGSLERFIGILIEHYGGAFPAWLSPLQTRIIPVNLNKHLDYSQEVLEALQQVGIRAEIDTREEKLGYKIRDAQTTKIPFSLVIGDKEIESKEVTYRKYGEEQQVTIKLDEYVTMIKSIVDNKE